MARAPIDPADALRTSPAARGTMAHGLNRRAAHSAAGAGPARALDTSEPLPRLSGRDVEVLLGQLARMVSAEIPLDRALVTIAQGAPGTPRATVAAGIAARMRAGHPPSRAFAAAGSAFDASALALLKSGELTGDLGVALTEIERLALARNGLRSKVAMALVYPAILALVAFGSVLTILLVVIPQFEQLVAAHLDKLPASARLVFALSEGTRQLALPLGAAVLVAMVVLVHKSRRGGLEHALIALLRLTGPGAAIVSAAQSAALFRLLGTLLTRQVQLMPALDVSRQTLSDPVLVEAAVFVREQLKSGARLSDALRASGAFPAVTVELARAGEETGALGPMLMRAAQMLEDDLERTTKLFVIWFEPILLLIIGGIIGGLLYGLFSAILSINSII